MKRFYSSLLTALLAFAASFEAHAQLTTTITWDIPGSVEIYVGGTGDNNKVALPEGATEYVATINNSWGNTYIGAAEGYALKQGEVLETGQTLAVNSYTKKVVVNMQDCNGKTVHITAAKIVYDAQFEINVVNGRDAIVCELDGTDRKVELKTGQQTVAYSSEFEQRVYFSAKTEGSANPYLLQDGEAVEWTDFYGTLTNRDGFPLHDGTAFEIKYCDTPDAEEEAKPVVTLNYADEKARQALTMIFNITQFAAIHERESFEVKKGDNVRFVFNTKDYDVTINDEAIEPSEGETTAHVITFDADATLNIAATDRQYGTTSVILWANDIDGLVLREGAINGPIVDPANITWRGTTDYEFGLVQPSKTAVVGIYQITVSEKSPKVYVSPANGYWIESSEYLDDPDYIPTSVATEDYTLKVLCHKFQRDKRLVVYLATDGLVATASDVTLRDNNHDTYPLQEGYNEFIIDTAYSHDFTASVIASGSSEPDFAYFCNKRSVAMNPDTQQYVANVNGNTLLHIFAGRPAPKQYTVTVNIAPEVAETTEVVADHFTTIKGESTEIKMFAGTEMAVTPGQNNYYLDGEKPAYDGDTHVFAVSADHFVSVEKAIATGIASPANGQPSATDTYNLAGQRVGSNYRGLVVTKGKTFINK